MNARHSRGRGYSLIELMISIVLSLMILAGLVTLFESNNRERNDIQRANQQTQNAQYALEVIGDDLQNSGYLASFNPSALPAPTADPDICASDVASLNAALSVPVQGYDDYAGAPTLSCLPSDVKAGTDILVIRRTSTCAVGDANCNPQTIGEAYFQASGCDSAGELGSGNVNQYYVLDTDATKFTLHANDCTTVAALYQYEVHIYFIATEDKTGDGIPTLKRVDLDIKKGPNNGFTNPIPIAEGIEQLQIDYGIDSPSPTGSPAAFTPNPYAYNGCAGVSCLPNWQNTVVAQVYVLARNLTPTPGHADGKTYTLGNFVVNPTGDSYMRHVYQAEYRLNNIAGRNTP